MTLMITMIVVFLTSVDEGNEVFFNSSRVFWTNSPIPSFFLTAASDILSPQSLMAGVSGLEPEPKVLETSMLTIDTIPLRLFSILDCRFATGC